MPSIRFNEVLAGFKKSLVRHYRIFLPIIIIRKSIIINIEDSMSDLR